MHIKYVLTEPKKRPKKKKQEFYLTQSKFALTNNHIPYLNTFLDRKKTKTKQKRKLIQA